MTANFWTTEKIARLIEGFENCTWPCDEWTHQAHLVVGLWYVLHQSPEAATATIREGIKRYNLSCGKQNTETGGYHETITRFYVRYFKNYLDGVESTNSTTEIVNDFCERHSDRNLPLQYYSQERLMSVAARLDWVEPDLQPLE